MRSRSRRRGSGWFGGELRHDHVLWGIHILWWGRLGKLAQFLGALTVIVEIVGSERLRAFGNSLHGTVSRASIRRNFADSVALAKNSLMFLFTSGSSEREALNKVTSSRFAWLDAALTLPIGAATGLTLGKVWWVQLVIGVVAAVFSYAVITPFLAALLIALVSVAAVGVDWLFIEPIAWCLERPAIDKLAKLIGAVLLIAGFHFDLLAS